MKKMRNHKEKSLDDYRNMKFWNVLLWCGTVCTLATVAYAATPTPIVPEGSGTNTDPYQIQCVENLLWIQQNTASSAGTYYQLTQDVDASSTSSWDMGKGFSPIGNENSPFQGVFDGNGYTIQELVVHRYASPHAGLFGYVKNATLYRVTARGCSISGSMYTGMLAGYVADSTVSHCTTDGEVSGGNYTAGLIGQIYRTPILKCCTDATVSGTDYVGGLIGENLVNSTITCSYAVGSVTGQTYVGGLTGWSHDTITGCYARASANGNDRVGGLAGQSSASITACYAMGNVTSSSNYKGGIAGYGTTSISATYWDVQTSGTKACLGNNQSFAKAYGLTTSLMKRRSSYVGWNFSSYWAMSSGTNDGYPWLKKIDKIGSEVIEDEFLLHASYDEYGLVFEWETDSGAMLEYMDLETETWKEISSSLISVINTYYQVIISPNLAKKGTLFRLKE